MDISPPPRAESAVPSSSPLDRIISAFRSIAEPFRTHRLATDRLIDQALHYTSSSSQSGSPFWAWLIVAAFYDRHDRIIWSTEIFAAHLDIQFESDDETSDSGSDSDSDSESEGSFLQEAESERAQSPAPEYTDTFAAEIHHDFRFPSVDTAYQAHQACFSAPTSYVHPPATWDPTHQGPVPGHWQAAFDPTLRRWVHTWQPL
ncbi:hypothetical protein PT974_03868 [Cladobotryum mycophilum]|uniref:Uncharacterized protein n=1 Tax=Cladobotryum mycophilum TaxID=491253 RepID=A0ABR0SUM6_9HYPO